MMDAPNGPQALCVTARVDRLCDRFEAGWKAGRRPSIGRYLRCVSEEDRLALARELILIDVEYRSRRGERPEKDHYRRRLPEYAAMIDRLWLDLGLFDMADPPLSSTAKADLSEPPPSTVRFLTEPSLPATAPVAISAANPSRRAMQQRLEVLRRTWPFSELPLDTLQQIAETTEPKNYATGEALIRQGDLCRHLLVLVSGSVDVRVEEHGHHHTLATVRSAALFGEMSLVGGGTCTASVVATSPVCALEICTEKIERIAARHPVVLSALGGLVANRLGFQEVDALIGKVVGGYQILRCAGRGGMAVVYEAEQIETGRRVALKMMSHRFIHDVELHNRFYREAEIGRRLRHRNICRVHGTFTALGTNFMIMDFCEGTTLDQKIRSRGRLSEKEVRHVLGRLAAAIAYAHRRGVCHRDLKPSNVMVDGDGRVRLMDFGLARIADASEVTSRGQLLGTPRYMPPEQLAGKPVDCRADVYAFGCIAYEMLAGRPLFPETSYLGILEHQARWSLSQPFDIRPRLSQDLYDVLRASLATDPSRRVLDLAALSRRWAASGARMHRQSPLHLRRIEV